MIIRFWGVRGSIPTPLTSQAIQSKIMAVIQRLRPEDLQSAESKSKFISTLPEYIFGTTGGNTACVEIKSGDTEIILDAGSGIRNLGKVKNLQKDNHYHMIFSHFHWDHIQGLPFFDPAYNPKSEIEVYSCFDDVEHILSEQMVTPYFPVPFGSFTKNFKFHKNEPGVPFFIDGIRITACKMSHPGDSYSYAFEKDGAKFVYATDVELRSEDFKVTKEKELIFKNADCIVLDSQYTVEEACRKVNWGHSSFCFAVDFAVFWNIKKIYLFHHEPTYDDKKLNSILQAARWYAKYIEHSDVEIYLAREECEIEL